MSGIDPQTVDKLVKICGLLGSDQAGERASAALQASRLLSKAGATWQDVIGRAQACCGRAQPAQQSQRTAGFPSGHAPLAAWALRFQADLTPWECQFLADIGQRRRLSSKQAAILERIVAGLRQGGSV
jgi:hypothetical protein